MSLCLRKDPFDFHGSPNAETDVFLHSFFKLLEFNLCTTVTSRIGRKVASQERYLDETRRGGDRLFCNFGGTRSGEL